MSIFSGLFRTRDAPKDRTSGSAYTFLIQNGFMCPNDVRELENLDMIPDELGGNKFMVNGNMVDLANVGAAYQSNTPTTQPSETTEEETQTSQQEETTNTKRRRKT